MQKHLGKLIHCIVEGADNHFPLAAISYKDITALVSQVKTSSWEEMGEEKRKEWVKWFQKANIGILKEHDLLPLRFGVIADDAEIIRNFLAGAYLPIKSAFDKIRGRVEYLVQVSCDLKAMLKKIAEERQVAAEKGHLPDHLKAIEVGKFLFEAAQARRKALTQSINQMLYSVSVASSEGKCTDESIVMNWSYLVEREKEATFDQAMEELGRENEAYLSFRYFGPLPPYSFVPLKFEQANYDTVEEAKKVLGLGPRASLRQIKDSYRRLSLKYHPDRNPGCPQAEEGFRKVADAYATLQVYCRSLLGSLETEGDTRCTFAREEVGRVFIVREN